MFFFITTSTSVKNIKLTFDSSPKLLQFVTTVSGNWSFVINCGFQEVEPFLKLVVAK